MIKPLNVKTSVTLILISACPALASQSSKLIKAIQKNHIESNVPEYHTFEDKLVRDLESYFKEKYPQKKISVNSELLRKEPTQSGLSYPKYYSWVRVKQEDGTLITSGAVRVEAIEQESFHVTNFVASDSIKNGTGRIDEVFPKALCDAIRENAKNN